MRTGRILLSMVVCVLSLLLPGVAGAATFTEFSLAAGSGPNSITVGPDGAVWFTEEGTNKIGRITRAGVLTEFPIPTAVSGPDSITTFSDMAL